MSRVARALLVGGFVLSGGAACGGGSGGPGGEGWAASLVSPPCREAGPVSILPAAAQESSGVAVTGTPVGWDGEPAGFWTHNDSGWPAEILRVGTDGVLTYRVQVAGAENIDWEDMAAGPCPDGAGAGHRCLYLADTGDNAERRAFVDIYRLREPGPGATLSDPAQRLRFRLPHGPRDIEAMVLLDRGTLLLVTKGRNHAVEVYLLDQRGWGAPLFPADSGEKVDSTGAVEAQRVQTLTSGPPGWRGLVTGAAAAPLKGGGWVVAVRTYQSLRFFRVAPIPDMGAGSGPLVPIPGGAVSLLHLREPQGEAVAFAGGGSIVLTSEGGLAGGPASLRTLDCSAGFERWGVEPLPR